MSQQTTLMPSNPRAKSSSPVRKATKVNRRQLIGAGGGLLLAFTFEAAPSKMTIAQSAPDATINGWIHINLDETVVIYVGGGEMGQGMYSGIAQVVAEELMVEWAKVKVSPVEASKSWITGGSYGIRGNFDGMRLVGASAREMLIAAAAQKWGVSSAICHASKGTVINSVSKAVLTYGKLASLAATLAVPQNPPLVSPTNFQLIGKPLNRLDIPAKTDGSAKFGLDVMLPGMLFATIVHCPTLGGTLASTPQVPPGALAVVPLGNAVAIVATNTYAAMLAAQELQVDWNIPASASGVDSVLYLAQAKQLMLSTNPVVSEQIGDTVTAFKKATRILEMTYTLPYLAHACMEVLNCTVRLTKTSCEVWAPTQAPSFVQGTAAAISGLPVSSVQVHPMFMGGGLGRKFEQDYVAQAVMVAKAIGKPVKLTWSREEDMQHDQYRPMALVRIRVALNGAGNIIGFASRNVSPSILFQRGWINGTGEDSQATDGATGLPYAFGNSIAEYVRHPGTVPVGFWRSVGHSINAFAIESALDEVALATKTDPLTLRRNLLLKSKDPLAARSLAVLNAAATLGGWGTALPAGHARGIAFAEAMGSIVAQVAEISQPTTGSLTVHKVACAIDCGKAINPNSVEAQMQGGVIHGLSAAMWGEVKFSAGRASVQNFNNYRLLLMHEAPLTTVVNVESGAPLGGVGEPGVPPIAPAVANALAKLNGTRVRTLPFFPGGRMGG